MSSTKRSDPKSHQTLAYFFKSLDLHDSANIREFIKQSHIGWRHKEVEMLDEDHSKLAFSSDSIHTWNIQISDG